MKTMVCSEAVVQSALGRIRKKIQTSVVEFSGAQAATLDTQWFQKLATDSVMYISCFGFVPVKLVKIQVDKKAAVVPVVVPLSQIDWEYETEIGSLFTCPRVYYKDNGSETAAYPRIYVYCLQSHTVDLCQLGALCSALEPYRQLLSARAYTKRCNEENLKNYRFVETRTREPPVPRAGPRVDMTSVLEQTMRQLPRDTNSHGDDAAAIGDAQFVKQRQIHALMAASHGMPCVLPDDCVVSDCQHEVPQLNMALYAQTFERSVYMALALQATTAQTAQQALPARPRTPGAGFAPAPPPADSTDEIAVLLTELEHMLGLFASATLDGALAEKVRKFEAEMQSLRPPHARKRKRQRQQGRSKILLGTESINVLQLWVRPIVECSIQPHVSSDMALTTKLYEEGSITKDTYSKYVNKTTGLDTSGASGKPRPTA